MTTARHRLAELDQEINGTLAREATADSDRDRRRHREALEKLEAEYSHLNTRRRSHGC